MTTSRTLSVKWKLAIGATAATLVLIGAVSLLQNHYLQKDIASNIAAEQRARVTQVQQDLDEKLKGLMRALEQSASVLPAFAIDDPQRFREHYAQRPEMLGLFDDLILFARSGRLAADFPRVAGREGVDAGDRTYFRQVMATGRPVISDPLRGRAQGEPIVIVAVPVRGADGSIAAVLTGVLRLQRANILGHLASARVGETGYFYLLTRGEKPVYVVHPDRTRILQPWTPGGAPSTVRALAEGFEGTAEDIDASGRPALLGYRTLHTTGWVLVSALPVEEALAPIDRARRRNAIVAALIALLVTPLVWFFAWRLFAPLTRLLKSMNVERARHGTGERFTTGRLDEFGLLFQAFGDLTALREHAEARVRASEARVRDITDNLPALVCYIDRDYRFQFNNRGYEKWLQKPLSDITGRTIPEVYGKAMSARLLPDIRRALDGESVEWEIEAQWPDGRACWSRGRYCPDFDEHGAVQGIYGLVSDVTEVKMAEAALEDERARMAQIIEATNAGTWEWNVVTGEARVDSRWAAILGYTVDELAPVTIDTWATRAHPEDRARIRPLLAAHLEGRIDHHEFEARMRHKTGHWIWVLGFGRVSTRSPDGRPTLMRGVHLDISARKQIESELAENRGLLQVTLDSIGDAVITTDHDGAIRWLNPVAERMTGWSKLEACGRPLTQVFVVIDEETRKVAIDPVAACIAEGQLVALPDRTVLLAKNGAEFGIEDSASPIRDADGELHGAVLVFRDVSEQRRLSQEMTHRATHDPLTGLVNRTEFETRLSRMLSAQARQPEDHALLYIDLDQFKLVNDACGHSVGDQLLRQVSAMLRQCVRGRDTVARIGGDEFGVILEHCDVDQAQRVAQKICDQMEDFRFVHGDSRFRVGASIGLVPFDARWNNLAAALQAADISCYAAKEGGRNRVHVWLDSDHAMKTRHSEMQWVSRIENALDEDRFELYAQRIESLDADAGGGLHCEVLLRMRDTDGTVIPPGAFLPAAERFHMATRIDRWVVREVFERLHGDRDFVDGLEMIAINLSGHSIGDRSFHRDIGQVVRNATFDVSKLCFEITETAAVTNFGDAKIFIDEMRALGVRIALDDFGAGASSFGYLKTLPVDFLKIDGQFITDLLDDPLDGAAVRCFRDVARAVGVRTIAEFVEKDEVRAALLEIGIDMAQGYLIHRPEPLANLALAFG